jgi:hypothetical protein
VSTVTARNLVQLRAPIVLPDSRYSGSSFGYLQLIIIGDFLVE